MQQTVGKWNNRELSLIFCIQAEKSGREQLGNRKLHSTTGALQPSLHGWVTSGDANKNMPPASHRTNACCGERMLCIRWFIALNVCVSENRKVFIFSFCRILMFMRWFMIHIANYTLFLLLFLLFIDVNCTLVENIRNKTTNEISRCNVFLMKWVMMQVSTFRKSTFFDRSWMQLRHS